MSVFNKIQIIRTYIKILKSVIGTIKFYKL